MAGKTGGSADISAAGSSGKLEWDRPEIQAWEKPNFERIEANRAETGILFGPEILILLS